MASFEEVLDQLAEIHDREIARLAQRCAQLEGQVSTDGVYVEVSDRQQSYVSRSASPQRSAVSEICCLQPAFMPRRARQEARATQAPSSCGEEPLKEDDAFSEYPSVYHPPQEGCRNVRPNEVFVRHFGMEVAQLGFRIKWSGETPRVQMLEIDSPAYESGLRDEDLIIGINGTETAGNDRSVLLPLLKARPLELQLWRGQEDACDVESTPHSAPAREVFFRTGSMNSEVSAEAAQACQRQKTSEKGSENSAEEEQRLGLKTYIKPEDPEESLVSRTVRQLLGSSQDLSDGAFLNLRRFASNFAIWWDNLNEPEREGPLYEFVEGKCFRFFSALVITVNAGVVTWLTDWSLRNKGKNMPPGFEFVDLGFLLFYLIEVVLRGWVSKGYFFVNDNAAWNIFDAGLVVFSSLDCIFNWPTEGNETPPNNLGYMRVFRMFKFAKILRTIRIISFVRELSMMLESFRKCMVAMFWGLVLLMFLLYVFALIFAQGVASHLSSIQDKDTYIEGPFALVMAYFGSVGDSMLSLYQAVTGGNDWSTYYQALVEVGDFYPAVFLSYTFFFIFALFNILTGVFVERAVAASLPDREELISEERKKLQKSVQELRALFMELDADNSGKISKEEFIQDMKDERIVSYMLTLGLEMHDAEHFFDIIVESAECTKNGVREVDIDTFIEHSMAMKGSASALDMRRQMHQLQKVSEKLEEWDERWPQLQRTLRRVGLGTRSTQSAGGLSSVSESRSLSKTLIVGSEPSCRGPT